MPPPPAEQPKTLEEMEAMQPKSELERLQLKANEITDESLDSTRRMLHLCEDSQAVGAKSIFALQTQGEQIDKVEEDMDRINTDMKEAEKALSGMEQCCGLFTCPCGKSSEFKENDAWTKGSDGQVIGGQPTRVMDDRNGAGNFGPTNYIAKITKDAREDEMEENMTQVSTMIGNLRNMAVDMGQEIGSQNAQLARIDAKAESNKARIAVANERAQKLNK